MIYIFIAYSIVITVFVFKFKNRISTYRIALEDMLFAYVNKDEDFPHDFENRAVNIAKKLLEK
jgi:hypothetical protein